VKATETHFSGVQVDIELINDSASMFDLFKLVNCQIRDIDKADTVEFEQHGKKVFANNLNKMKSVLVKDFVEFNQIEQSFNNSIRRKSKSANLKMEYMAREVPCPLITCRTVEFSAVDEYIEELKRVSGPITNEAFDKLI
jgi:hypothetical protein